MIGLFLCILIFSSILGALFLRNAPYGILLGICLALFVWMVITPPIMEYSPSEVISSTTYKIEEIKGRYWSTTSTGNKTIYYIDEGKDLVSCEISKDKIEYSNEVAEPTFVIEKHRLVLNDFMKFWLTGLNIEGTKHRVIMPRN